VREPLSGGSTAASAARLSRAGKSVFANWSIAVRGRLESNSADVCTAQASTWLIRAPWITRTEVVVHRFATPDFRRLCGTARSKAVASAAADSPLNPLTAGVDRGQP